MKTNYLQQIIFSIKEVSASPNPDKDGFGLKYVGTDKSSYHLNTKSLRDIAKNFVKSNDLTSEEYLDLLNSLYYGETYDELAIASLMVGRLKKVREILEPKDLHFWLDNTHGWAECDILCQMAFDADDFLPRWSVWEKAIRQFAKDKNIQVRRASLVLLTKPLRVSTDDRLVKLALKNVDLLKGEKDILITKAVSWILRAMIKNHKEDVAKYLQDNLDSLPKIAIREVSTKLNTGKKYINKKKK